MVQGAIKDTTTYVNYVYNISSKGTAQVSSQLLGLSSLTSSVLGQLAFQTSSYLSTAESHILTFGTLAVAGLTKATSQAIEFDYALKNIEAIAGSTNMSSLGEQAMAMSNKYGVAVNEMTEGLESLARAGVSAANMPKVLEEGMKLAKLEGLDLETAMTSLISTTNLLDTSGVNMESPEYADAIAKQNQRIVSTSEVSPIGANDIINTLEHVGGYASSTNLDQEDLFAVIAQLGAKGTRGEIAGTSLRAFVSAGQKDTAQRALSRIGLSVKDLWENDEQMMSITDMKDVLDEAMDAKGYTKQERLEFYSDFAGYKQANQIMKIDTDSARDYKQQINDAWSLGDKLQHILGSTQANLQSIFQTSVNFLTKVGQGALTLLSPLIWVAKTILDVVTNIPFMDKIFGFGLVLVGARAISTIFNKIVPTIAQMTQGMGGFKNFISNTKDELIEMKDGFVAIKKAMKTGDLSYFEEKSRANEFNRPTNEDILEYRNIEELKDSPLINYYLSFNPATDAEKADIASKKERDYQDLLKEIRRLRNETPEERNKRQKSQQTTKSDKQSERTKALQEVSKTLKTFDDTLKNFQKVITQTDDVVFFDNLFNKIKNHTFKVAVVNLKDKYTWNGPGWDATGDKVRYRQGSEVYNPSRTFNTLQQAKDWERNRRDSDRNRRNRTNRTRRNMEDARAAAADTRSRRERRPPSKHVKFHSQTPETHRANTLAVPEIVIDNLGDVVDLESYEGQISGKKLSQAINMVIANEGKRTFKFSGRSKNILEKELQRKLDKAVGLGGYDVQDDQLTPRSNILDIIGLIAGTGELSLATDTSYDRGRDENNHAGYDTFSDIKRIRNVAAKDNNKSFFGAKQPSDYTRKIKTIIRELSPYERSSQAKKIAINDSEVDILFESSRRLLGPAFDRIYTETMEGPIDDRFDQLKDFFDNFTDNIKKYDISDEDIGYLKKIKKRVSRGEKAFNDEIYKKVGSKLSTITKKDIDLSQPKINAKQRFAHLQRMMDVAADESIIMEGSVQDAFIASVEAAKDSISQPYLGTKISGDPNNGGFGRWTTLNPVGLVTNEEIFDNIDKDIEVIQQYIKIKDDLESYSQAGKERKMSKKEKKIADKAKKIYKKLGYGNKHSDVYGVNEDNAIKDLKQLKEDIGVGSFNDIDLADIKKQAKAVTYSELKEEEGKHISARKGQKEITSKDYENAFDDIRVTDTKESKKKAEKNNKLLRKKQYLHYLMENGKLLEDVPATEQLVPHAAGQVVTRPVHQNRYVYATSALMANPFMDESGKRYREDLLSQYSEDEIIDMENQWKEEVLATAKQNLSNNSHVKAMAALDSEMDPFNPNFKEYRGDSFFVDLYKDLQYKEELKLLKYTEYGEETLAFIAEVYDKDINQIREDIKTVNTDFMNSDFNSVDLEIAAEALGFDLSEAPVVSGKKGPNKEDKANYFLQQLGFNKDSTLLNKIIQGSLVGGDVDIHDQGFVDRMINLSQATSGSAVKQFNENPITKTLTELFKNKQDKKAFSAFAKKHGFGEKFTSAKDATRKMLEAFDPDKALGEQEIFQDFIKEFGIYSGRGDAKYISTEFPETRVYKAELYDQILRSMGNEGYAQQTAGGMVRGKLSEKMYAELQEIAHIAIELQAHEVFERIQNLSEDELKELNKMVGLDENAKPKLSNLHRYIEAMSVPIGLQYQRESSTYQDRKEEEPKDLHDTVMRGLAQIKSQKYTFSNTDTGETALKNTLYVGKDKNRPEGEYYQEIDGKPVVNDKVFHDALEELTFDELEALTLETERKARPEHKVADVRRVSEMPIMINGEQVGLKGIKSQETKRRIFKGRKDRDQPIVYDESGTYIGVLKNEQDNYNDVVNPAWQMARNKAGDQRNLDIAMAGIAVKTGLSERDIVGMEATEHQQNIARKKFLEQKYVNVNQLSEDEYNEVVAQMEDAKKVKSINKTKSGKTTYDVSNVFRRTVGREELKDMVKAGLVRTDEQGNYVDVTETIGADGDDLYEVWDFRKVVKSYDDILQTVKVKDIVKNLKDEQQYSEMSQGYMAGLLSPFDSQLAANKKEIEAIKSGELYGEDWSEGKIKEEKDKIFNRKGKYKEIFKDLDPDEIGEKEIELIKKAKEKYKPLTDEEKQNRIDTLSGSNEEIQSIKKAIMDQGVNYEELLLNNPMIALMEVLDTGFLNANENLTPQNIIAKSLLSPGDTGLKMFPGSLMNPDDILANINVEKLQSLAVINPDILKNIVTLFYSDYANEFIDILLESKGMDTMVADLLQSSLKVDNIDTEMKELFNITGEDIDKTTYTKDVLRHMKNRFGETVKEYNGGKNIDLRSINISGQRLANAFKGIYEEEGDQWLQNDMVKFFMNAFGMSPDSVIKTMFDADLLDVDDPYQMSLLKTEKAKIRMARKANKGAKRDSSRHSAKSGRTDIGTSYGDVDATMEMLENEGKVTNMHLGSNPNIGSSMDAELKELNDELARVEDEIEAIEADILHGTNSKKDYDKLIKFEDRKDELEAAIEQTQAAIDKEADSFEDASGEEATVMDVDNKTRESVASMYTPTERAEVLGSKRSTSISSLILGVQAMANAAEDELSERRQVKKNQEEALANTKMDPNQRAKTVDEYNAERKRLQDAYDAISNNNGALVTSQMISGTMLPNQNPLRDKLYDKYKKGHLTKADLQAISGFAMPKKNGKSDVFYYDKNKSKSENLAELERVGNFSSLPKEEYIKHSSFMNALVGKYEENPLLSMYGRFMDDPEAVKMMRTKMLMYGGEKAAKVNKRHGSFLDIADSLTEEELYAAYYDIRENLSQFRPDYERRGYVFGDFDESKVNDKKVKELREYFSGEPSSRFGFVNALKKPFLQRRAFHRINKSTMTPKERGEYRAKYTRQRIKDTYNYLATDNDLLREKEEKIINKKYKKEAANEIKNIQELSATDAIKKASQISGEHSNALELTRRKLTKEIFEELAQNGASNPAAIMEEAAKRAMEKTGEEAKDLLGQQARTQAKINADLEIEQMNKNLEEDPDYLAKKNGYTPNRMLSFAKNSIDRTFDFIGNQGPSVETYDEYISNVEGFSNKVSAASSYLEGFTGVVQNLAEVFPPLQGAVTALTITMGILNKVQGVSGGLIKFMGMGKKLRSGKSIRLMPGIFGEKGLKVTNRTRLGKAIMGGSGMLGKAGSFLAANAGPIAIILIAIAALALALKASYESHKKYVDTLKKERKELQSQARSLEQQTYILKRQADHTGNEKARARMLKQLEVAEKKLIMVQTERRANTINLAMANQDIINGETGLWYKITSLWGGQQSHVDEREGLYSNIQRAHEWDEGLLTSFFSTDAISTASALKTLSPVEFEAMEAHGTELKSLYDMQSRAIKRTGSYEAAENDQAYQRRKKRIMNQTGLDEKQIDTLLENMQVEHQASEARDAMKAEASSIRSQHNIRKAAARMGVDPKELEAMKGTKEYQRIIIQAQADMLQREEQAAVVSDIIKNVLINGVLMWASIMKIIFDIFGFITTVFTWEWLALAIKAGISGGDTSNWKEEDRAKLEAPGRYLEDIGKNVQRVHGNAAATVEDIKYLSEVSDSKYNDKLMQSADSVYDDFSRGNFGHGPKNMYYMGGQSGVSGGRYRPGTGSQSNNAQTSSNVDNQNQIGGASGRNQRISSGNVINDNGTSTSPAAKNIVSAGTTQTPVSTGSTLSPKSSAVNDATAPNVGNVVAYKSDDNSQVDNSSKIDIQTININTEDDPEAIKAMFLELIIELQEQINPRLVSRTVGEPATPESTDTAATDPNAATNGNGTESGGDSGSGSGGGSPTLPSGEAVARHHSTDRGSNLAKTQAQRDKYRNLKQGYNIISNALYNPNARR